jgi:hypothetical protein
MMAVGRSAAGQGFENGGLTRLGQADDAESHGVLHSLFQFCGLAGTIYVPGRFRNRGLNEALETQ